MTIDLWHSHHSQMRVLDLQLFSTLLHISIFLNHSISTKSPPRSPSPVSLEPLRFDDDPSLAFLTNPVDMNAEQLANKQHSPRNEGLSHVEQPARVVSIQSGKKRKPSPPFQDLLARPKRGRRPYLTAEEKEANAREQSLNWRKRKKKEDGDYFARQARRRRKNRTFRQNLGVEIKGKPGKSPKLPFSTKPP